MCPASAVSPGRKTLIRTRLLARDVTTFTAESALRVARLARIPLSIEEAARLAPTLEAIAREFGTLAVYAESLPPREEDAVGGLREDAVRPSPPEDIEALRRAIPRLDPTTNAIQAPRGSS